MLENLNDSLRSALHHLFRRPAPAPEPLDETAPPLVVSQEAMMQLTGAPVEKIALYEQALRHRSLIRNQPDQYLRSNERLEFLGDAVLGFVVADHLYHHFPERDEGFLTRLRAKLVNGQALARCARRIDLGRYLLLSDNMEQAQGRQNQTILADAFEAVIGALYLDLGVEAARAFIHHTMLADIDLDHLAERKDNYKSLLLEYVQAQGWPQPQYRVTSEEGPSHAKVFTVEVVLNDRPYGHGRAGSKKKAEQMAANEALRRLREEEEVPEA